MFRRNMLRRNQLVPFFLLLVSALILSACAAPAAPESAPAGEEAVEATPLVVYSGRNENLVGPLIEQFSVKTGIEVEVRYGGTSEMAATILEEGNNSPADVFYGQDAGALGALERAGRFVALPEDLLSQVDARFHSDSGQWIGSSGRARVFVYNTESLNAEDVPNDIWALTEPEWAGRIGWAPTNGSFQAFVTALRVLEGEERAQEWLEGMIANDVQIYSGNTPIVEAVGQGEVELGLVNHYYLYRFLAEDADFPVRNHYPNSGDAGSMINVAGAGIISTSENVEAAEAFVRYLLSPEAQQYFANETNEYPLIDGIDVNEMITPISELTIPEIDLSDLDDLEGTLTLLQDVGALD